MKKIYKNYKELCEDLGWSTTRGDTKKKQLKELDSMCEWHKEGYKIIIDKEFEEKKEIKKKKTGYYELKTEDLKKLLNIKDRKFLELRRKEDGIKNALKEIGYRLESTGTRGKFNIYNVQKDFRFGSEISEIMDLDIYQYDSVGVYIIIDDNNNCYVGSTTSSFYKRCGGHWRYADDCMKHTYNLIHNGGRFKILEDMTGKSEKEIRVKEQEYINKYSNGDNYNLINERSVMKSKPKHKSIKVDISRYDEVIELLKSNGFDIK